METTTLNKGNPFDPRNRMVCLSLKNDKIHEIYKIDEISLDFLREVLSNYNHFVGFNIKFDLHWCKRYDLLPKNYTVHDCQIHFYMDQAQTIPFPDLNTVAQHFNLPVKPDKIKEYWESGVDTADIPWEELKEYALHDTEVTYEIYKRQPVTKLQNLCFHDLQVLQEMEWNGLNFDRQKALDLADKNNKLIEETLEQLNLYHNVPGFNWGSNEHLSALLYGGTVRIRVQVPDGFFKSGQRKGQVKYRWVEQEYKLPRIYTPPKRAAKAKEGVYAVDEATLKDLVGNEELINGILKVKALQKDNNTYLLGFPRLQDEHNYPHNKIYGNFNQTIARTGRLSSSSPNLQNCSDTILSCFTSRYDNRG
ncbi:DNA polymerase [Microcystis sp. M42BS1]|uniref:DNA polymerase n=1 Tax=Microcystis sp. M42BS1 TaxID=2771192 RepID=UPI00258352C4|nr:DNA polymerase [Microcystis sp. M42BS1]